MRIPDSPGFDFPVPMVMQAPTSTLVATAPKTHIQVFDFNVRCFRFRT